MRSLIADARSLETQAQSQRAAVSEANARMASFRRASGAGLGCTLSPQELALATEIDELRSKFQEVIWELWRVKAEVDELQQILEEDAAQFQKEFEAWLKALRKRQKHKR